MRTVWLNAFALGAIALATMLVIVKNNHAEAVPVKPPSVGSQPSAPAPAAPSANRRMAAPAIEARTVVSDNSGSVTTVARNQGAAR